MRIGRVAAVVACVAASLIGTSLGAAFAQTATGGFGAAPANPDPADPATRAYFKPVLVPGASFSDAVVVTSTSDTPLQVLISAVDGLTGQTSGAVYGNREAPVKKAGMWVTPSVSALSLAPHSQQLVPFTIRVPARATPGDHLAGVAVENANPRRSSGQFAVTTVIRTVVGVDITVPGPAEAGLRLGGLALKALPGTHTATLSMQLGDDRGKLVKPMVSVSLRGPSRYQHRVNRQLDTILPGDTIAYPFIWPDSLVPGVYKAVVRATGGPKPIVREATLRLGTALHGATHPGLPTTSSFPLAWAIGIALAAILAILMLVWLVRKRRPRSKLRAAPPRGRRPTRRATRTRRQRPDRDSDVELEPISWDANAPTR